MARAPTRHNKTSWREDETLSTTPAFGPVLEPVPVLVGLGVPLVLVWCKELEMDEESPSTVYTRT
jgi:hypothetical protein